MPSHRRIPTNPIVKRVRGVTVHTCEQGCVIRFSLFARAWPSLAKGFRSRGFTVSPKIVGARVQLQVNSSLEESVAIASGRSKVRKPKFFIVASSATALASAIAIAAFVPSPEVNSLEKFKPLPCSPEMITVALESESTESAISLEREFKIGGVASGTVTCDDTRYSYALELQEPKRVLKLEKLDS